jgi:Fe2+ transport system protein FeoA
MGILPGEILHVMRNDSDGPLLVQIHGGSVMLGRGLAEKIRVQQE